MDFMKKQISPFLLLILLTGSLLAGIKWQGRFQGELGIQQSGDSRTTYPPGALGRFLIQAGLNGNLNRAHLGAWFRLRPEVWTGVSANSVRYAWSGFWKQPYRSWLGQLQVSGKQNFYHLRTVETISFSIFHLSLSLQHRFRPQLFFTLEGHLLYRDLNYTYQSSLDAGIGRIGLHYFPHPRFSLGLKLYYENFHIALKNYRVGRISLTENPGWRLGPEISLEYQNGVLLNCSYRFLVHHSRLSGANAREQWLRLVGAWNWKPRWYFFLLADYYFLTLPDSTPEQAPLLYSPLDNENRVFLKIAHSISARSDLFLKGGYLQETLVQNLVTLSGWQFTTGLDVRF